MRLERPLLYPVEYMVANRTNLPDALKHLPRDPDSCSCNNALQAALSARMHRGDRHARTDAVIIGRYLA